MFNIPDFLWALEQRCITRLEKTAHVTQNSFPRKVFPLQFNMMDVGAVFRRDPETRMNLLEHHLFFFLLLKIQKVQHLSVLKECLKLLYSLKSLV